MKVNLAYGDGYVTVELPKDRLTVIEPLDSPGLPDERAAVFDALDNPITVAPLREVAGSDGKICIVFTDITRATPNERLIPWLMEYLSDVDPERITLLNALGTHRPNTKEELEKMLTPAVVEQYQVINHEPENPAALVQVGQMRNGTQALLNKHLVEADIRIITGFIEPHFFAGFSGGPKGIIPGVAGLDTVISNHGAENVGHPDANFGITEGNPLWEELRDIALKPGPSFLLNVALNNKRRITGVFAGDLIEAHKAGTEFVRASAMQKVEAPFDIVITTNSGYPLDLNLYQGVKGMRAAERIVKKGGTIILAAECREGVPTDSHMDKFLRSVASPEEALEKLHTPGFTWPEQWEVHMQALVQQKAEVLLYSSLPDELVTAAHLKPCKNIEEYVRNKLDELGPSATLAVLPQGPLTIPYCAGA
ncbi:MAG: nickel-dependent lactate racemase [Verrucomicrobia bacterium]|nr:nickel-dependent lactate racemase [Verrucomicrobiota bacterium]MCF7708066.1 nickel-dependent lactate racemase [Verrucomicrobiota bacterium]